MDPIRFDTLARSLTTASSRRHALALALGGAFGLLGARFEDAGAHDPLAACKKKSGKQKKKCLKKANAHNATHTSAAPPPPNCVPTCAGKGCGADDGCGGTCQSGSCAIGTSCISGQCFPDSGTCSPSSCTNGRECQEDGSCQCPPEKPHVAPEQYCNQTCRECCIDSHCEAGKVCKHDQGSICVCVGYGHKDCGNGCRQCCSEDDCYAEHGWSGGQVTCTAEGSSGGSGLCRCDVGFTQCGGAPKFCVDTSSNSNHCGFCNNVCRGEATCQGGECK